MGRVIESGGFERERSKQMRENRRRDG